MATDILLPILHLELIYSDDEKPRKAKTRD